MATLLSVRAWRFARDMRSFSLSVLHERFCQCESQQTSLRESDRHGRTFRANAQVFSIAPSGASPAPPPSAAHARVRSTNLWLPQLRPVVVPCASVLPAAAEPWHGLVVALSTNSSSAWWACCPTAAATAVTASWPREASLKTAQLSESGSPFGSPASEPCGISESGSI
jgi:hypothetical protein